MCAKLDSLLMTFHAEEGIDLNDYFGKEDKNIDNNGNNHNNNDNNEMGRKPAATADGCARRVPAPPARHSPARPVVPAVATMANADQTDNDACAELLESLVFNFQARYPHVFVPTSSLVSGQATVVGYWLVPSVDQKRFSVEVSSTGTHRVFTMKFPGNFLT